MARGHLDQLAAQARGRIIELCHRARTPHLGSSLSPVDILVALYFEVLDVDPAKPEDPDRDRFVLSKGHAAPALYVVLAQRGFFPEEVLDTYTEPGGVLAEHPAPNCVPGVEAATGSLGHGPPMAVGMALAARMTQRDYRVVALASDGECNEGALWEAAMMAPAHGLDNMTLIVDFNRWQATGRSTEIMALEPLAAKFSAFGWETREVDGHDAEALVEALTAAREPGRPRAIVAHTVKGRGVSFMEDDNNWHYRIPTEEEVAAAHRELGLVPA